MAEKSEFGEFEPEFNYERVAGFMSQASTPIEREQQALTLGGFLGRDTKDKITAICLRDKLLSIGTSSGKLCVLDPLGHLIRFPGGEIAVNAHSQPVCLLFITSHYHFCTNMILNISYDL